MFKVLIFPPWPGKLARPQQPLGLQETEGEVSDPTGPLLAGGPSGRPY